MVNGKFEHGGDVYDREVRLDFSININPLGMPSEVKKAAHEALDNSSSYPDPKYQQLKNEIAKKHGISPEFVCVGNGAADLIFTLIRALQPKKALLIAPSFSEYEKALSSVDCDISYYVAKEENHFEVQEDLLEAIRPEHDFFMICNPNNPIGNVIEHEFMQRIIMRCNECHVFLCIDECFKDFVESSDQLPLGEYFILKAFTKMYAMPGLRLGYGLCNQVDVLLKMQFAAQTWPVSTVAQAAGMAALALEGFEEKTKEIIAIERKYMEKALGDLGFEVFLSKTNYIFFRAFRYKNQEKTVWDTLKEDLLNFGINIRDCSNFRGLNKGYYRIGLRRSEENQELIKKIFFLKKSVDFFKKL